MKMKGFIIYMMHYHAYVLLLIVTDIAMDPSCFHKPWIEKLLSTFDPHHQTPQTKQDSLVGQVLKIEVRFEIVGYLSDVRLVLFQRH